MAGFEQTIIIGNVGNVNDLRYTQNGKAVFSFSVAVNRKFGEREVTKWYRVTTWEKAAEQHVKNVTKGMQIQVVGIVEASAFTAQDGKPAASLEMTAREITYLGGGQPRQEREPDVHEDLSDIPF